MAKFDWGSAGAGYAAGGLPGGAAGGIYGSQKGGFKKLPTMDENQQQLWQKIHDLLSGDVGEGYGESLSFLRDLLSGDPEAFKRFEAPYMEQFQQETVPGLAERFAGQGALSSSGFGQSLSAAGSNLQTQLASLKSGLQQQAAQSLMGEFDKLSGKSLGKDPFMYAKKQSSPGLGYQLLTQWAQQGFPGMPGMGMG